MVIKLSNELFDYLIAHFAEAPTYLVPRSVVHKAPGSVTLDVDEEAADCIRDWATKALQRKGFDEAYELTAEGKLIDGLIDAFYVE